MTNAFTIKSGSGNTLDPFDPFNASTSLGGVCPSSCPEVDSTGAPGAAEAADAWVVGGAGIAGAFRGFFALGGFAPGAAASGAGAAGSAWASGAWAAGAAGTAGAFRGFFPFEGFAPGFAASGAWAAGTAGTAGTGVAGAAGFWPALRGASPSSPNNSCDITPSLGCP